jgi:UDP-N-acetylmuramate dehydrogenase
MGMQLQKNISLKEFNSFGIETIAKDFAIFNTDNELFELVDSYHQSILQSHFILGGGSNILFTTTVIDTLVLKNELRGIELIREDENHYYVAVAAGENWHQFVLHCIKNNWAGAENLSLIPGNVGASPIQNIGAYGVEVKDIIESVEAYHIGDKTLNIFSAKDCAFDYRDSIFKGKRKNQFIITKVLFRLNKKPEFKITYGAIETELEKMGIQQLSIRAISDAVIQIRKSKLPDPSIIGNAGSFFKNPSIDINQFNQLQLRFPEIIGYPNKNNTVKIAAGWLIEKAGWKGYRLGDAGCHSKQALVLVNYGHATGLEILDLSIKMIASIKEQFDIDLEREVNIL